MAADTDKTLPILCTLQVTKEVTPSQESVDITKSVTPLSGEVPTIFTFTITLDPGRVAANDVVLEDKIPPQLRDAKLLTPFNGKTCKRLVACYRTSATSSRHELGQAPAF